MRFPQNPEMETLTFEAALFIGGDNEYDAHIRYTPGFQMNHAELADILHDAYYDGSVNEEAFAEWDDLKHERRLFQERMDHLATGILDGKESAFKQALANERPGQSDHVQRFDPGAMGYPESSVRRNHYLCRTHSQKTAMGYPESSSGNLPQKTAWDNHPGVHPGRAEEQEDGNNAAGKKRTKRNQVDRRHLQGLGIINQRPVVKVRGRPPGLSQNRRQGS